MDSNTTIRLARAMTALINLANLDEDAAKKVFDAIILEEQIAVRTTARMAAQTPVASSFEINTPVNDSFGTAAHGIGAVQTPTSPTSHKLANQVIPQALDTKNTTIATEPKSKTCYILILQHSTLIL